MLPSVNLSSGGSLTLSRNTIASKFNTLSLCENGANETPRYHEMVGMGLPAEKQAMLTESPSCTVTVPFRFMVVGAPVYITRANLSSWTSILVNYYTVRNLIQSHLHYIRMSYT